MSSDSGEYVTVVFKNNTTREETIETHGNTRRMTDTLSENKYFVVTEEGKICPALDYQYYTELDLDEAQAVRNALNDAIVARIQLI